MFQTIKNTTLAGRPAAAGCLAALERPRPSPAAFAGGSSGASSETRARCAKVSNQSKNGACDCGTG